MGMAKIFKKQNKKIDTEDVTAMIHDFQEPICLSIP